MTVKQHPASGRFYFPNKPQCLVGKGQLADFTSVPSAGSDLNTMLLAMQRLDMPCSFRAVQSPPPDDYLYSLHGLESRSHVLDIFDYQRTLPVSPYYFIGVEIGWPMADMDYPEFWAKYCNPGLCMINDNLDLCFFGSGGVAQAWINWAIQATVSKTTYTRYSNGTLTPPIDITTEDVTPNMSVAMMGVNYNPSSPNPFSYTNLCNIEVSAGVADGSYREYDSTALIKAYLGNKFNYDAFKFYPQIEGWTAGTGNLTIDEQWLLNMVKNVLRQDLHMDAYGAVVGTVEAYSVSFSNPYGGDGVVRPNYGSVNIPALSFSYPPPGWR